MQTGTSVIIHPSPIIQQGIKSILLSRNISITEILNEIPEFVVVSQWKDMLILADKRFGDELTKHARILKKNGNTVIGIFTGEIIHAKDTIFDDMICIDDNMDHLLSKINGYLFRVTGTKSDSQLSVRETEILKMVAQGFSNKQIAVQLFLSIHTVITHRKNITSKLGIKSIPGLTLYAALNNLVDFQR
ncbi:MAG: LuxR C-terminal-related transcriptional regulator [Bacteroidales bacterium]|nr:LuxR C-terminal-related transcriptional regulator [Bacteroidales bacterium]